MCVLLQHLFYTLILFILCNEDTLDRLGCNHSDSVIKPKPLLPVWAREGNLVHTLGGMAVVQKQMTIFTCPGAGSPAVIISLTLGASRHHLITERVSIRCFHRHTRWTPGPPFNDETSAPGGLDIWFHYSSLPSSLFCHRTVCFVHRSFFLYSSIYLLSGYRKESPEPKSALSFQGTGASVQNSNFLSLFFFPIKKFH